MSGLTFALRLLKRPRHKPHPVYLPKTGISPAAKDEQFVGPGGKPLAVSLLELL